MKRFALTTAAAALLATTAFADAPFKGADDRAYPKLDENQAKAVYDSGVRYDDDSMASVAMGGGIYTTEGEVIGSIEEWEKADGNTRMVVELNPEAGINADKMVITLLPGNVMTSDDVVMLDTSLAELKLKADKAAAGVRADTVEVFIK